MEPLDDTPAHGGDPGPLGPPDSSRVWVVWWAVVLVAAAVAVAVTVLAVDVSPSTSRVTLAAGGSWESFRQAYEALGERVAAIGWWALAAAVLCAIANSAVRTRAWRNILAAAYPHSVVRWWDTFRAYYAGVGINSVVPARVGDLVKLFLIKRRVRDSTYPALASSLLAESVFDALMATVLLIWAWQLGIVPELPSLPSLPAFEISWYADRPWILGAIVGVLLIALVYATIRVRSFWARVRQGLVILTMPGAYLRRVALLQAVGWALRVASAYWFLTAFNVPATLHNALLVQVASSVGTLLPATPGGLGPKQALIVILLAGTASRGDLLAFSVGIEAVMLVVNVVLGLLCMASMIGSLRMRDAVRTARREAGGADQRR